MYEAIVVRDKLTQQGYQVNIADQHMNSSYGEAIGGIKLQVLEEEKEAIIPFLIEEGDLSENDFKQSKIHQWIGRFLNKKK